MASYAPGVTLAVSSADPTRIAITFEDRVPPWVEGYFNAIFAREFSRQEITMSLLTAAHKQIDQMLENLVSQGLIFRIGADPEFKSAGE